ncbi:MAG: heavy-metal-associated domain-containing protein [Bdellovibrionota bacterium]
MSEFKVPDMTCGHCEKAITGALKKAAPDAIVKIDLAQKLVDVRNLADETVESLLKDLGYSPQKVK